MTTIAFRDGLIAADTMISSCSSVFGFTRKIARRGSVLAGACGGSVLCRAFLDWFNAGMNGEPPKMRGEGMTATAAVFYAPYRFLVCDQDGVNDLHGPYFAMGSGGTYAKGALAAGADPAEAVRIAAQFDHFTGGEIEVLSNHPLAMARLRETLGERTPLKLVA